MNIQYVLLVDDQDTFLGTYEEKELCHTGKGIHHRAFVVCLFNSKKEILLQRRKHKRWDNVWDVTAISHVLHFEDHDESYEEAALRSLDCEMGIQKVSLKNIGGFNYFAEYKDNMCENEYCAVLIGDYENDITPNYDVIYEYQWVDTKKFIQDCKDNPDTYAPWTIFTAKLLGKNYY